LQKSNIASLPTDRLAKMDFPAHNDEQGRMWAAFWQGKPYRIPIILGTNTRFFLFNSAANSGGTEFQRYIENPDVMFDTALRNARWSRFNLLQDGQLGLPERWGVSPDFQNFYEAAWFGCKIHYMDGEVPDTLPAYKDNPEALLEKGMPGPFDGIMGRAIEYYERFADRAAHEEFLERPIDASPFCCGFGTDGPMTVACNVFGASQVCTMMASAPERLHVLLDFITESTVQRIRAWRARFNQPEKSDGYGAADDSIALISTKMYREHVLPYHRRLYTALGTGKPGSIHLCGNATRHFVTLRDELNVMQFDTGFPVDFGRLRKELGPDVLIQGGPHVELLLSRKPAEIRDEVRRILATGVLDGGKFILREGNNLAPHTPLENTEAMYYAGREFGQL